MNIHCCLFGLHVVHLRKAPFLYPSICIGCSHFTIRLPMSMHCCPFGLHCCSVEEGTISSCSIKEWHDHIAVGIAFQRQIVALQQIKLLGSHTLLFIWAFHLRKALNMPISSYSSAFLCKNGMTIFLFSDLSWVFKVYHQIIYEHTFLSIWVSLLCQSRKALDAISSCSIKEWHDHIPFSLPVHGPFLPGTVPDSDISPMSPVSW